jgi:hypothetical protein
MTGRIDPSSRFRASRRTCVYRCAIFGVALIGWTTASSVRTAAQPGSSREGQGLSLEAIAPALYARLIGVERAQGVLFGALSNRTGKLDEADVLQRMIRRVSETAAAGIDSEAERGFEAIGKRGAALIRGGFAFDREVIAIYASRSPDERKSALDAAVRKYRSGAGLVLPDAAKDMSILYDHAYSSFVPPTPPELEPRRELPYPKLTGFMWAARWYELAVVEPLDAFGDPAERDRGLATVAERFRAKLSFGTPPNAFPTELPLAPAIAPGLVALHDRSAAVIDNLNMMLDIIADVLVHPAVADRRAALDEVIARFADRQYRCVQVDEWIVVALRHSIFAQGGPALASMTAQERNAFSGVHGQHYGPRRLPPACDPE